MTRGKCRRSVGLALGFVLLGCDGASENDTIPIHLGATISRTGVSAVETWRNAFELAAADASEGLERANYPTNKRLRFETWTRDTINDVQVTVPKALNLVRNQNVKMILNGTSSDALALNMLAYDDDPDNDLDVPIVCVACSSPMHHDPNNEHENPVMRAAYRNEAGWHFGLSMSSARQAQVLWNIMVDKTPVGNKPGDMNGDGKVKISTIAIDDPFGIGFQNELARIASLEDADAIIEKTQHPNVADVNQYDWDSALDLMTDKLTGETVDVFPDFLMEFTFPNFSLALAKTYSESDVKVTFLHTHSMREQTVILASEHALDGHEGTSYLPADGDSGDAFNEHFEHVLGIKRQSQWDAHVYDAAFMVALATVLATREMEDPAAVSGAQIKQNLRKLNVEGGTIIRPGPGQFALAAERISLELPINYEGASGPCDFDDHGRALNKIAHWIVRSKKDIDIATYDCVADASCPRVDN